MSLAGAALSRGALAADLREHFFRPAPTLHTRPAIGAEAELLALSAATRRPCPIEPAPGELATLPVLRRLAARGGWHEEQTAHGAPKFRLPDGSLLSYEPGGQLELSSAPATSVGALVAALHAGVLPLRAAMREAGIELLSVGIDPFNALEATPLRLTGERYARMAAYFARRGAAGARMMRQTAAFQVNLDWAADAGERALQWQVLNAAAPYLTAIFAGSPRYADRPSGYASYRAQCWRELDPLRTGALPAAGDGADEYLEFALRAPWMLHPTAAGEHLPLAEWLRRDDLSFAAWRLHLTTLFPEVRPKGYLEVRGLDALEPAWYAAPLVLLSGLVYAPAALRAAAALLGRPDDAALLARAARCGLADPEIRRGALALWEIGLWGAAELGPAFVEPPLLERAREFAGLYTRAGRAPGHDVLAWCGECSRPRL